jgi:hypothetical protein
MALQIRSWQIIDGKPQPVASSLAAEGRYEKLDLETWIAADSDLIASDLMIIGRQVMTESGPLDLLAVDRDGNIVICELKRAQLPRDALVQAIDYASDVATWSVERLSEICAQYGKKPLLTAFAERFPDVDLEAITINESQRIILVGFEMGPALERMLSWLANNFAVPANAVILAYSRTKSGDELVTRTAIFSEEVEEQRTRIRKFQFPISDTPGTYAPDDLRSQLKSYLTSRSWSSYRIGSVMLPVLLEHGEVSRDQLRQEIVSRGAAENLRDAGHFLSLISQQFSSEANDFLRQVVSYEKSNGWKKISYALRTDYRELVAELLHDLGDLPKPD